MYKFVEEKLYHKFRLTTYGQKHEKSCWLSLFSKVVPTSTPRLQSDMLKAWAKQRIMFAQIHGACINCVNTNICHQSSTSLLTWTLTDSHIIFSFCMVCYHYSQEYKTAHFHAQKHSEKKAVDLDHYFSLQPWL